MTVTKMELANTLFEELGLNKRESKEFVDQFFEQKYLFYVYNKFEF